MLPTRQPSSATLHSNEITVTWKGLPATRRLSTTARQASPKFAPRAGPIWTAWQRATRRKCTGHYSTNRRTTLGLSRSKGCTELFALDELLAALSRQAWRSLREVRRCARVERARRHAAPQRTDVDFLTPAHVGRAMHGTTSPSAAAFESLEALHDQGATRVARRLTDKMLHHLVLS